MPEAVIGDFDSILAESLARIPAIRQHVVAEQATTDFDKALRSISAPIVLALGFAGARLDHGLAAMTTLVARASQPCILIGPKDVAFAAPPRLELDLVVGEAFSLFPMARVRGESSGLEWPIAGIDFAPDGMIGTSNRVVSSRVVLEFDRPGMLVILPRRRLDAAIRSLRRA
jgi:thiamine pyrophosphokinase